MPFKKGLYTATIYTASSWKHYFHEVSVIASRIHLLASRAGNYEYRLGPSATTYRGHALTTVATNCVSLRSAAVCVNSSYRAGRLHAL